MKYIILVLLLVGNVACRTTDLPDHAYGNPRPSFTESSALNLYEVAFRYQFVQLGHPDHSPAYIEIEGHAPPEALLRRLATPQRPVLPLREGLPSSARAYWLQLGATTATNAYVMACDSRHKFMRGFFAQRRNGRWIIVEEEIVTIS